MMKKSLLTTLMISSLGLVSAPSYAKSIWDFISNPPKTENKKEIEQWKECYILAAEAVSIETRSALTEFYLQRKSQLQNNKYCSPIIDDALAYNAYNKKNFTQVKKYGQKLFNKGYKEGYGWLANYYATQDNLKEARQYATKGTQLGDDVSKVALEVLNEMGH